MWIGALWAGQRVAMWIAHLRDKFRHGLLEKSLILAFRLSLFSLAFFLPCPRILAVPQREKPFFFRVSPVFFVQEGKCRRVRARITTAFVRKSVWFGVGGGFGILAQGQTRRQATLHRSKFTITMGKTTGHYRLHRKYSRLHVLVSE